MRWAAMIAKAKLAINRGKTRGQYIRDNSEQGDSVVFLQTLSDAYSEAMRTLCTR